jgi:1-deoxy-D-xylulose-5-phosphate reductoisomerase
MKGISILGSTGSIGCNSLKVIEHLKEFRVVGLSAGRNMKKFAGQVAAFRPEVVSCDGEDCAESLLRELHALGADAPRVETGEKGLIEVATHPEADIVVSATVGAVGFIPTLRAIEAGKSIALANKETLVMAGELMTAAAAASGAEILPVDSEHNAIHQCLRGERRSEVKRLILTASGGPFRTKTKEEIENATLEQALAHPNWKMGDKITIDSATLMNKGLEVIEAHWLFGFDAEQISVVVHPQSVVHSMVEMVDGSIIAQMGVTDMRHAIQYALTYPERKKSRIEPFNLCNVGSLSFEEPDFERFPCLRLAYEALRQGGTMPTALNAANEMAVQAFLNNQIRLSQVAEVNESVMSEHRSRGHINLSSVLEADLAGRKAATELLRGKGAVPV